MRLGVEALPPLTKDLTDRNCTCPSPLLTPISSSRLEPERCGGQRSRVRSQPRAYRNGRAARGQAQRRRPGRRHL